jgi:hypothetical protein
MLESGSNRLCKGAIAFIWREKSLFRRVMPELAGAPLV